MKINLISVVRADINTILPLQFHEIRQTAKLRVCHNSPNKLLRKRKK